jgi:5'-nucleotidase/UDP-sugar diphosphatase
MKNVVFAVAVLLFSLCVFAGSGKLTILHINDTHGHAWAYDTFEKKNVGGFARIAGIVDSVRNVVESEGGHVIVLHAGDFDTGVPESDLLDASPDIVAMDMIGFDAVALGNHEFDNPRDVLMKQISYMNFPALGANIFDSKGKNPIPAYMIKDFGDIKVAICGFTTEETKTAEPLYLGDWRFDDVIVSANRILPAMDSLSDVTIAVTHLGWAGEPIPGMTTSKELAEGAPALDVIVDGHSHTLFEQAPVIGKTVIVQAGDWGEFVGKLDLTITDGKVTAHKWVVIPVGGVAPDSTKPAFRNCLEKNVKETLDKFFDAGSEKTGEIIGETKVFLDGERENARSKTTNLSNLITDAMRWKTGADIAFANGGTIRTSIQPGKISYRNVLTVLPFGNTIWVFELTGKELIKVLDFSATVSEGKGGFLHVSGLKFERKKGKARNIVIAQPTGEVKFDEAKTYRVAVVSYLAQGGDGYTMFGEFSKKGYDTNFVDAEMLKEYIANISPIEKYDDAPRVITR